MTGSQAAPASKTSQGEEIQGLGTECGAQEDEQAKGCCNNTFPSSLNPKLEIRRPKETRRPKPESNGWRRLRSFFGLRVSDFNLDTPDYSLCHPPFGSLASDRDKFMNAKLLLRTILLVAILLLLVIMGMNNRQTVSLSLPPILIKTLHSPAAFMYFGFFALGVLSGTILTAGKKSVSGGGNKAEK